MIVTAVLRASDLNLSTGARDALRSALQMLGEDQIPAPIDINRVAQAIGANAAQALCTDAAADDADAAARAKARRPVIEATIRVFERAIATEA